MLNRIKAKAWRRQAAYYAACPDWTPATRAEVARDFLWFALDVIRECGGSGRRASDLYASVYASYRNAGGN